MPDQPTPGEIGRSVARIEGTLQGMDSKVDRLDDKVDGWREEVIELRSRAEKNAEAIAELKAAHRTAEAQQDSRRWLLYLALLAAGLAFLSQLYFASQGS